MIPKFCQYCGEPLSECCNCEHIKAVKHLYDFLLLEHEEDSPYQFPCSEERAMLERAEHMAEAYRSR